jgi:hypothetical protein
MLKTARFRHHYYLVLLAEEERHEGLDVMVRGGLLVGLLVKHSLYPQDSGFDIGPSCSIAMCGLSSSGGFNLLKTLFQADRAGTRRDSLRKPGGPTIESTDVPDLLDPSPLNRIGESSGKVRGSHGRIGCHYDTSTRFPASALQRLLLFVWPLTENRTLPSIVLIQAKASSTGSSYQATFR